MSNYHAGGYAIATVTASDDVRSRPAAGRGALRAVFYILLAGLIATLAFDMFGQWLSPLLGFSRLAPVALAKQSLGVLFGADARAYADVAHYATGVVGYAFGYVLLARPIARALLPGLPWPLLAAAYGVVLWAFALYVMAHLVAGNSPFLNFGQLSQVALVGHVAFALALAGALRAFRV